MSTTSRRSHLAFSRSILILVVIFLCSLFIQIQPADAASVTLAWDPSNSESDLLAGYKLYYGKAIGTYESVVDVGNQTTYTISDLEDGKTYHFMVRAYNIFGKESEFSSELRYPEPFSMTIPLVVGSNLISLPLEPLNPSISALTEQLSTCLLQVLSYAKDAEGYDTWLYYDPLFPDQNTLGTMEPGKGYWVDMACPGELTVVGNRTTNPRGLTPGLNLVGYNSLIPLPVSQALSSIGGKYTTAWAYKDDQWLFHDSGDVAGSTLQTLTPGSGYWIEATEQTTWTLPSVMTIPLSTGWNLISLPIGPINPDLASLKGPLSPCLIQAFWYSNDSWEFYDPAQIDQSTLTMLVPGKGYWVEMACPGEMTVVGNRTSNPIPLTVGENLVGYNSLTPLPVSEALSSIANQYFRIWTQKEDQLMFYDPRFETESTLKVLTPGSGYYIEALEETSWALP